MYLLTALLIAGALLVAAASYVVRDLPQYLRLVVNAYEKSTGLHIQFDDINWSIAAGAGVHILNLSIAENSTALPYFKCDSITMQSSLSAFLKKRFAISRITLQHPVITVQKDSSGRVHYPNLPVPSSEVSGRQHVFDYSVSLKRITVENAAIRIHEPTSNTFFTIERITGAAVWDKKKNTYSVSGSIKPTHYKTTSSLTYNGSLWFAGRSKTLHTVAGDMVLRFTDVPVASALSYFTTLPRQTLPDAFLSGTAMLALTPDHDLTITGSVATDHIYMSDPSSGQSAALGPLSLDLRAAFDSRGQGEGLCTFTVATLPPVSITATSCRSDEHPGLQVSFHVSPFEWNLLEASSFASTIPLVKDRYESFLRKIQQGTAILRACTGTVLIQNDGQVRFTRYDAALSLESLSVQLHDRLPAMHDASADIHIVPEGLSGTLRGHLFETDKHTINFSSTASLDRLFCTIQSEVGASDIAPLLKILPIPSLQDSLSTPDGKALFSSSLVYTGTQRTAEIDLTADFSELLFYAGRLVKARGIPFTLALHGDVSVDNATQSLFCISAELDNTVSVTSSLQLAARPFVIGSYSISRWDIADLFGNTLPRGIALAGGLSGSGLFAFPLSAPSGVPVLGTLLVHNASLLSEQTGNELIGLHCYALLSPRLVSLLTANLHCGVTNGILSGALRTLNPPTGRLMIKAGLFDLDNFLATVGMLVASFSASPAPFAQSDGSARNPLLQTNLDMDFSVDRFKLMGWDFSHGTCQFTFRNGVMRWDAITICGGGGTLDGSVEYNLLNFSDRILTITLSRSEVDVTWAIPGMQKTKTLTGTLNITGIISSRFSSIKQLGNNMRGTFETMVTKGVIRKFTVLSKILSMINIVQLAHLNVPDLFDKGMPYDEITASFSLANGIMKTENLMVRSPAMNLSAVGDIDLRTDAVDLIVGTQVLTAISNVIGTIPFAGELITGKDKTLTVGYFHVKGPYNNASVKPMPLKSLSGPVLKVLKSLRDIPRDLLTSKPDNATTQ